MMMFMKTFSFFILIVILAISGSYLLNSQHSPMKKVLADKHNELQVSLPTPNHHAPESKEFLSLEQIDKIKMKPHTQEPAPKVETPSEPNIKLKAKKAKTPSLLVTKDKPTEPSTPVKEPAPSNDKGAPKSEWQPSQDQNNQTLDPLSIDIPTDTVDDEQLPPPDSVQQTLYDQCVWMVTNLDATESQLPTKFIPAESQVINPNTRSIIGDEASTITFDKTITGKDFTIRYIVTDGMLSIMAGGNVPKELFPPGFSE